MNLNEEFKYYALFSVQVDRFFNIVNIYGMYHDKLKTLYSCLPNNENLQKTIDNTTEEGIREFLLIASMVFSEMSMTNIFSDKGGISTENIPKDILNFSFYTCYCFQWTLFENFIKKMVKYAIEAKLLPLDVIKDLESNWKRTKVFLDLINSGRVFGTSPFTTILPLISWDSKFENCDYSHLDAIRELRNQFIHGVESPEIMSETITEKQSRYEHSMWILRKYAENVFFEVQTLFK